LNQPGPTYQGGPGGNGHGFADIPPSYGTPGPSPTLRYFAGGGGGGSEGGSGEGGVGGYGGGGDGSSRGETPPASTNATANTGGGGGGGDNATGSPTIKSGGSGIVVIRYAA